MKHRFPEGGRDVAGHVSLGDVPRPRTEAQAERPRTARKPSVCTQFPSGRWRNFFAWRRLQRVYVATVYVISRGHKKKIDLL
jgi:hypothetical protein